LEYILSDRAIFHLVVNLLIMIFCLCTIYISWNIDTVHTTIHIYYFPSHGVKTTTWVQTDFVGVYRIKWSHSFHDELHIGYSCFISSP